MESPQQNVSEDGRTISPGVTRSMTFLDGTENSLPTDVVIEIFSRMTSKSIARSRCVSRLWESILGGQNFTDSFLAKSCACPQILFLFQDYFKTKEKSEFLFFSSPLPQNPDENSSPQPLNPDEKSSVVAAKYHLAQFRSSYEFFDLTDGFFCYGTEEIIRGRVNHLVVSVICNPATRQSLTLPKLKSRRRTGDSFLGYDPIAKEFKVLSMTCSLSDDKRISEEHQVLTVATKNMSWRKVECSIPHSASRIWICISGVLYYIASPKTSSVNSMVVCFDLRSEKFSVVEFMETPSRSLPDFTTTINYNGKLGLLMSSEDHPYVRSSSTSFELWVLEDAGKHLWSKNIYVLPPQWKDSVPKTMRIAGMVGTSDIVLSPRYGQHFPSYVIYYNVKRKTITKVGIKGMEAIRGKRFDTFLNYVENVKLI